MIRTLSFFIRRYQAHSALLLAVMTVTGAVESLTVAALYPILATVFDADMSVPVGGILGVLLSSIQATASDARLAAALGLFIVIILLNGALRLLREYTIVSGNAQITLDAKRRLFSRLIEAPYATFLATRQGDLIYRLSASPQNLSIALLFASTAASAILSASFLLVVLFSIEWRLTVGMLLIAIPLTLMNRLVSRKITGRERSAAAARELGVVQDFITGAREIVVAGAGPAWARLFAVEGERFRRSFVRDLMSAAIPGQLLDLVLFGGMGVTAAVLYVLWPTGLVSLLPIAAVYGITARQLLSMMGVITRQTLRLAGYQADLETIHRALTEQYPAVAEGPRRDVDLARVLRFEHVDFSYPGRSDPVLKDVTFDVRRGELVAVVGESGVGKSTLLGLVIRLADVTAGTILVDGTDLREFKRAAWLARLGYVSQEVFVYGGTIAENIAFGASYSDEEIQRVAREAHADGFIMALPDGYQTVIGDRGMTLSAGQRQRLAIARALIRRPQLLVLDEATSALDSTSESLIQQTLQEIRGRCTVLVVAHRLSTVQHADRIVVLEHGRVSEHGSHEELLARRGAYYELARSSQLILSTPSP